MDCGVGEEGMNNGAHPLTKGGLLADSAQEPYCSGAERGVKAHNGVFDIGCHDALLHR